MSKPENCGKCKKPKSACKCGRPEVVTKEVLQKLKDAFMYTFSDEEACLYAGISTSTLYNYQKKYPEFLEIKQQLRLHPNMNAKKELVDQIKGNIDQAKWWAKNHKSMRGDFGELQELKSTVPMLEVEGSDAEVDALTRKYNSDLRALYAKGPDQKEEPKKEEPKPKPKKDVSKQDPQVAKGK